VASAKLMGASDFRIIFLHILPNTFQVLFPILTIGFNNAVLAEASMSYLSLGVQPPEPSLGRMLSESQAYMFNTPWYSIFPGITIIFIILGFSLLAEGLRAMQD
jgi:peptide/nickel transport system permease protein